MRGPVVGLVLCAALAGAGCGSGAQPAAAPRWESLAPATLARTEVAAARVGRFVYVMGGFVGPGGTPLPLGAAREPNGK